MPDTVNTLLIAHELGEHHFGDAYTIEHREFSDGDIRTVIIHTHGFGPETYAKLKLWCGRDEVWREYHENDRRLTREVLSFDEWSGAVVPERWRSETGESDA